METSSSVTVAEVKAVVVDTLAIEERADALHASTPLLGSIPELDSMAVIELVVALQERFAIIVEDEDVSAEVFETLASLTAFVDSKTR
jgi:acyl carrier protein